VTPRAWKRLASYVFAVWSAILGVLFFVYFLVPSKSLPAFIPGHQAGNNTHLVPDSILSAFLAMVCVGAAVLSADAARHTGPDRS
jgi:hypothetical protein